MKKRKCFYILGMCLLLLTLTACGKSKEIETYKVNMDQFFENIRSLDASINSLDPNDENVSSELLGLLDQLDESFAQMADLQVPDGFPGVAELSKDASTYMSEAVSYYHQAYDGEEYDKTSADIAYQNYKMANVRFQYIVQILHGDIPEEIFSYDEEDTSSDTEDTAAPTTDTEVQATDEEIPEEEATE